MTVLALMIIRTKAASSSEAMLHPLFLPLVQPRAKTALLKKATVSFLEGIDTLN